MMYHAQYITMLKFRRVSATLHFIRMLLFSLFYTCAFSNIPGFNPMKHHARFFIQNYFISMADESWAETPVLKNYGSYEERTQSSVMATFG
jgi:hypothetical protein